jgi:hypothetical protein
VNTMDKSIVSSSSSISDDHESLVPTMTRHLRHRHKHPLLMQARQVRYHLADKVSILRGICVLGIMFVPKILNENLW